MSILLLCIMISACSLHGVFLNLYGANYPGKDSNKSPVYSSILGFTVAFITFAVSGFEFNFSWIALVFGAINGVAVILFNYFLGKASEVGPYSFVMISALSAGILMPLFLAVILDGFPGVFKILGILVMLVAFFLLCVEFGNKAKPHKAFYPMCIILGLANGAYAVINALEGRVEGGAHNDEFIITTYLTTSLLSTAALLFKNAGKTPRAYKQTPKSILFALLGSACIAANINCLMLCLRYVPESTMYTILNGGTLVASALLSLILFKEKITLQKWCGVFVAALSMVLLSI